MSDTLEEMWRHIRRLEAENEQLRSGDVGLQWKTLDDPLTSTSWDGDSFGDVGSSTELNLQSVFGAPAGIRAIQLHVHGWDTASFPTNGLYFACGPSSTRWYQYVFRPLGGSYDMDKLAEVNCDSSGHIWYRINAGTAMILYLEIWKVAF